ncbi:MAG: 6-bladed beta-propeller [Acidobacteriota bacterium]|nr:6-bladed beta-propeller [Acidobacteriota bacterium]
MNAVSISIAPRIALQSLRTLAPAVALCALLTAGDNKELVLPGTASTDLTWPLPPDPPRVKWLAEYTDMAKVKKPEVKKISWLDRVTGTKTPEEKQELRKPYGITADSRGRIYTADTELKTVFIFDPVNRTVETRESTSRAPLALPAGVALDANDRLFVSDAELHTIICYSPSGQPLAHFGMASLGRPGGIAIDRQRNRLYVADAKNSTIAVFGTKTLDYEGAIGRPSTAGKREPGTLAGPTNVAIDRAGNLFVADTGNYRVQVFDSTGKFIRSFGAQGDRPGEFIRPKGIATDSEGHVYVADAEFNNFQILSPEGQPLLAVGTLGGGKGEFALIAGIYVDSRDRIYTTEMFRGRIQVFQYIPQAATSGGPAGGKEAKATKAH